jgi:hypothetical protein
LVHLLSAHFLSGQPLTSLEIRFSSDTGSTAVVGFSQEKKRLLSWKNTISLAGDKSQFNNSVFARMCIWCNISCTACCFTSQSPNFPYLLTSTTMDLIDPHFQKLIYSSVVTVITICGHFTTVLMATDTTAASSGEAKVQ